MKMRTAMECPDFAGYAVVKEVEHRGNLVLLGCYLSIGLATDSSDVTIYRPIPGQRTDMLDAVPNELMSVDALHVNRGIVDCVYRGNFVLVLQVPRVNVRVDDIVMFHDSVE